MWVSYEFQMRTWLIRAVLARIWPYRLLWNSYCWQHITGGAESMEIQSLSATYEIMSGGNQISLMYRGGCGGRFVTRQICSKSQLVNIFATVPGDNSSWIFLEKHHLGIICNERFSSPTLHLSECPEISDSSAYLSLPSALWFRRLRCSGDVLHHKAEAKSWCEALDDSVTGCSVLVRAPKVWKTPSAEKGGYVNMWLHTCNNMMSTFYALLNTWEPPFGRVSLYLLAQSHLSVGACFS